MPEADAKKKTTEKKGLLQPTDEVVRPVLSKSTAASLVKEWAKVTGEIDAKTAAFERIARELEVCEKKKNGILKNLMPCVSKGNHTRYFKVGPSDKLVRVQYTDTQGGPDISWHDLEEPETQDRL